MPDGKQKYPKWRGTLSFKDFRFSILADNTGMTAFDTKHLIDLSMLDDDQSASVAGNRKPDGINEIGASSPVEMFFGDGIRSIWNKTENPGFVISF